VPELVALGSAAENAGFDLLANTARDRFLWPGSDPQDEDPELGRITRAYEDSSNKKSETTSTSTLTNADIAELLAMAAESAKQPIQKALRRASRKSLLWPEEAATLIQQRRSLEELPGIGPSLSRIVKRWLNDPPEIVDPPAIRKGFQTILQARAILDANPTWRTVKGDLQMHTLWSDGTASVAEMAQAAVEYGHEYVAITDHAKGLKIAGGINENQLAEQSDEIAKLNEQMAGAKKPLRVLRSVELNLNVAGEGDMEPQALAKLDVVLGCFHSALRKKEDQTERYLAALRNPTIQILGHPRGRIYNFRLGLTADWRRVFDAAAELDKAVEIDCYPDRQDISPDLLKLAAKAGCRISLGTDSHGPSQLRFIELGLAAAMTAKIKRDRILNFTSAAELLEWVGRVRQSSGTYLH
jgi:histidinol phosphatase-like PHP family hydrolase